MIRFEYSERRPARQLFHILALCGRYILGIMQIKPFANNQLTVSDRFSANFPAIYLLASDETLEKELDRGSSKSGAC